MKQVLIGNSFPFSLIQRTVKITVVESADFNKEISGCEIYSFWGHTNTLKAAEDFTGMDLTPHAERPVLTLSEEKRPVLCGVEFDVCWILSPVYSQNFRPAVGEEVSADFISGWMIKRIEWS